LKRPLGVTIIGYFYLFGAFVLVLTAIFYQADANAVGIADRFGIPAAPERLVRILLAIVSLVMAYGYLRLKTWGFWVMIAYSCLFGIISSLLMINDPQQPFIGNLLYSLTVIMYTIYVRKAFFKKRMSEQLIS